MIGSPTDHGFAVIKEEADGTKTVYVSASVSNAGRPAQVFAVHHGVSKVVVGSGVTMAEHGPSRWSHGAVDVFDDGAGAVHVVSSAARSRNLDRFVS